MPKMTGAQYLAEALKGYGVTHLFHVPAILRRTMVELEERTRIDRIVTHGEKAAAYMADGYARALYLMFLVAEVHPFKDGNGRVARIFLNAELSHAGLCRVIIPTVLRDDYLLALKGLTHNGRTEPYLQVVAKAQEFTAAVNYEEWDACVRDLERRNAFRESDEARLIASPTRAAKPANRASNPGSAR